MEIALTNFYKIQLDQFLLSIAATPFIIKVNYNKLAFGHFQVWNNNINTLIKKSIII
jgi:hypothetical protein